METETIGGTQIINGERCDYLGSKFKIEHFLVGFITITFPERGFGRVSALSQIVNLNTGSASQELRETSLLPEMAAQFHRLTVNGIISSARIKSCSDYASTIDYRNNNPDKMR